jgi:dihydroorotase
MPVTDTRPLLLINCRVVDPATGRDEMGGVLIENGLVRDVGRGLISSTGREGTEVRDCKGCVVAPGLVDARVFVGEPGEEHRETLRTAGMAAAAGGVTTMICMPDTSPPLDDPASIDFIMRRARDRSVVRVHPMAAITKGLAGCEMAEMGLLREAGAVAFSDGARSVRNAQVMRRALTYARMFDALIVHHCEDADLVGDGVMNEGEFAARLGLQGVSHMAETIMLERDMRLVTLTGGRYHASLISCTDSLEVLRRAKDAGLKVTAGVSINNLTFNENDVGAYRTFFKLSPPLRSEEERQALVAAVAEGLIDIVVSDHNPQDVETKRQPFAEAADGAVGLETMLSAGLRLIESGQLTMLQLIGALSTRPADVLGLPVGRLTPGAPADVVIFDPDRPWVCDPADLKSRCKNTPFDEARMQGRVVQTIVAGRVVHTSA